jgi:hypothetical protein
MGPRPRLRTLGGLLMADELAKARTLIVSRLVGQRNGDDLSVTEQFIAREIGTLLQVLLLEKKVGK